MVLGLGHSESRVAGLSFSRVEDLGPQCLELKFRG